MGLFSFIGKVTLSAVCLATPGAQMGVLPIWLDSAASGDGSDVGEWKTLYSTAGETCDCQHKAGLVTPDVTGIDRKKIGADMDTAYVQ